MSKTIQLHHWLNVLRVLYHDKCNEVQRLLQSKKYPSKFIIQRQREADKLKEVIEGLTNVTPLDMTRLQIYSTFDKSLTECICEDPHLLGCTIILGQDNSENYPYFSRFTWNIPISFFRS